MPNLKYDTDTMRQVAADYIDTANTLTGLGRDLEKQIADLRNIYWKSDAGAGFQERYKEGWMNNVNNYAAVLQEMSAELNKAAEDYDRVTAKLREIEGVFV